MNKKLVDILERTAFTAVEAGLAYGITQATSIKAAWAIPVAAGLAYLKGAIATKFGNKNSASAAPSI